MSRDFDPELSQTRCCGVHSPADALGPGSPGSGGGGGEDAVFPVLGSLNGAFGDPAVGLHSVNGLARRKRVPPENAL